MKSAHGKSSHGESGSVLTRALSDAQVSHVVNKVAVNALGASDALATLYRIYTEDNQVVSLVSRYFQGASLFHPTGLWAGQVEAGLVIEIVGTYGDRQKVVQLAADIAAKYHQSEVLVTWHNSRGFETVHVYGESTVTH